MNRIVQETPGTTGTAPTPSDVRAAPWWRRCEAPTWAVAAAVYAGWGLTTWNYQAMPWWLALALGGWFVCWHGSLQHEALHGHPTRHAWVNAIVAYPPLWLWLPYPLYREYHLIHHRDERLTSPLDDPESYYVTPDSWAAMGGARRALLRTRNTLLGRLCLGPPMACVDLAVVEARRVRAGDFDHLPAWLGHVAGVAAVLYWAVGICGIPPWEYVALFAYPGLSLTMLRSFAEHRPAPEPAQRTVVVDASPPMRLLYLNNNYHAPHHARPELAWYDIPAYLHANRAAILHDNGGYVFRGYAEQFRRFLVRPKDAPVHPGLAAGPA